MNNDSRMPKNEWVKPAMLVYGDMTTLTQQSCDDTPKDPCKPKVLGFGDDFSVNISTV